ncbi:tyrosine-type recombinase/integrase [Mannheimia indoligenes]|uniref:Tyrosine-type recombinase/integrase n=1 Tax=Mannheimia indoligenes TaxID=3103145 RepID=A0ABU7ZET6_9PAST
MAIIIKPLTMQQIKIATENDSPLRDGDGLYMKITANNKIWRLDYKKPFTGKRTSVRLGIYPQLSLVEARKKRAEYRALLEQNIDPIAYLAEQKRQQEDIQANTFKNIAERWKQSFKSKIVMENTMLEDWRRLENHIFPILGDVPVSEINSKRLISVVQPMYDRGHSNALAKTLRLVVEIMDFAENTGIIEFHNCHKAHKAFHFAAAKNNPTIPPKQVPKLIQDIYESKTHIKTKLLIFWSLLTAVRPAEVVSAEWSEIDWQNKTWTIPKEKMKGRRAEKRTHIVPLSSQAIAVLNRIRQFTGDCRFVFPHFKTNGKPMSSETVNMALKRNGYKGILTSHGIRSIIRTYLADQGIEKNTAETVLAHKIKDELEQTYNRHDYLNQRTPVMQLWGDYLSQCGFDITKL